MMLGARGISLNEGCLLYLAGKLKRLTQHSSIFLLLSHVSHKRSDRQRISYNQPVLIICATC